MLRTMHNIEDIIPIKKPDVLKEEISSVLKNVEKTYLYHIDINYFKDFYDKFGPNQQNSILCFFKELLDKISSYCARNGEGEFIVVVKDKCYNFGKEIKEGLEHITLDDSSGYNKVKKVINNKLVELDPTKVTVRVGVASYNGNLDDALKRAKKAKDLAKSLQEQVYVLNDS